MIGINRTSSDSTAILSLALSQFTQLIVYMFVLVYGWTITYMLHHLFAAFSPVLATK